MMRKKSLQLLYIFVVTIMSVACESDDKETPGPTVYFKSDGDYEISLDDTLTLSPKIIYDYGSTYQWTVDGEVVSDQLEYEFVPSNLKDYSLTFTVVNSNGSDSHDVNVSVVKAIDFSSFDNYTLPKKASLVMKPYTLEGFIVDDITFSNSVLSTDTASNPTMWSGFAFSSKTSLSSTLSTSVIGCAYSSTTQSAYMAVSCYSPGANVDFGGNSYSIKSIDLAWDNFPYLVSKFGYTNSDSTLVINYATQDEYVKLHIYGLDNNGNIVSQTVQSFLNCEFDNPAKYVRWTSWQTIELAELGSVCGLSFEIESTQDNYPPFFCIDNLKLQE